MAAKIPARPPGLSSPVFSVPPEPVVSVTMCGTENMSTIDVLIHRPPLL